MSLPLYRSLRGADWGQSSRNSGANMGLVFDKFFEGWEADFSKVADTQKVQWVERFARRHNLTRGLVDHAARQEKLVSGLGGTCWWAVATSRFVTGTGIDNPLENGFAFHHTLGVPYLAGSGLKGALRAYGEQWLTAGAGPPVERLFGRRQKPEAGSAIFFDMLPVESVAFVAEVMTPHYGKWYQDSSEPPADWHAPTPIPFLAVEHGAIFRIALAPRVADCTQWSEDKEALAAMLKDALRFTGLGAKTAVGYGRFELCDTPEAARTLSDSVTEALMQEWSPPARLAQTPDAASKPAVKPPQDRAPSNTSNRPGGRRQVVPPRQVRAPATAKYNAGDTLPAGTELTWSDDKVVATRAVVLKPGMQVQVALADDASDIFDVALASLVELRHIK
jgi:CRISPR-associated protein Cmr6